MTHDEARDAILRIARESLLSAGLTDSLITYTDIPATVDADKNDCWARVVLRHGPNGNQTLADSTGKKKYERVGTVFVQVFAAVGDGSTEAYRIAEVVQAAFETARLCDVWFRNTRLRELGASGAYEQINVTSDFNYDTVR